MSCVSLTHVEPSLSSCVADGERCERSAGNSQEHRWHTEPLGEGSRGAPMPLRVAVGAHRCRELAVDEGLAVVGRDESMGNRVLVIGLCL